MAIALALPTLGLSRDEADLVEFHLDRMGHYETRNRIKEAYYRGTQRVRNLGITLPTVMTQIETVVGWPTTVVEVPEERLDFLGWTSEKDLLGLDDIYLDNALEVDSGLGHLDSLLYGTGFVIVGSGFDGEPQPLVTVESARNVTGEWDGRLRRLSSAFSIDEVDRDKEPIQATLYLPDYSVTVARNGRSGRWQVANRDEHRMGRVPVVMLPNRPRASRPMGRSEISRAVRSYTDMAVRTLLGMEVHREFYQAPQRYALGADESQFTDSAGNVKTGWEVVMGRMLAIPRDEDTGELPVVGQFSPASPAPYLDQARGLAQFLAAEAGLPLAYLGVFSENPSSADAIRALEARLVKRAERRQVVLGRAWREVAYLSLLTRDGSVPDEFRSINTRWRDAATPTRAAAADEAVKLVGANILPADSSVTYDRIGLSPQEQKQIAQDKRRAQALATVRSFATPPPAAVTPAEEATPSADANGAVPQGPPRSE